MKKQVYLTFSFLTLISIANAQTGNVGIGTTTPAFKLDVVNATGATDNPLIRIVNSSAAATGNSAYLGFTSNNALGTNWQIGSVQNSATGNDNNFYLNWSNGAALQRYMTLTATGRVGIGVAATAPNAILKVIGNGGSTTPIGSFTNSNVTGTPSLNIYPGYSSDGAVITEGNQYGVVFDQDPGVTLGANQAVYDFHGGLLRSRTMQIFASPTGTTSDNVLTNDASGNVRQITMASLAANITANYAWSLTGNAGAAPSAGNFIGTQDANDFAMRTNNAERMRITSTGYYCLGTTTPLFTFENAQMSVVTGSGEGIHVQSSASDLNGLLTLEKVAATTGLDQFIFFRAGGANIGNVIATGASGVAYNTTSDIRLKENICNTHYGIGDVMKIQVRDYNYKKDETSLQTGFIAQQLYTVFPNAVTKGGADVSKPWMVDYSKVTPLLTKAIQDQQTEIEALRAEVNALKNANDNLKAEINKVSQLSDELNTLKASIEKLSNNQNLLSGK
jgi:hypothetical protein